MRRIGGALAGKRSRRLFGAAGLGALLALTSLLSGCASARPSRSSVLVPKPLQSKERFRKEYVLGPDDQVEVVVQRAPEVSRNVLIRPDGYLSLPLLGDVKAAGLTPGELASRLTELFSKRLLNPEVTVIATKVRPAMVYVAGDVAAPTALPLSQAPTAMQAIALTGGFKRSADEKDVVVIRLSDDGHLQALPLPRLVGGQPGPFMALSLLRLQADDLIFVPENGRSQFSRFITDIINQPLSGINSLFSPLINYRLIQVLGQQTK